ncbi:MAG TPA: hypothetical protein VIL42_02645 [Sphingomicrobium sp.]|jgi:hypothetical protein
MAQHGYLHDEYDSNDFGRGDDRDDRERNWRDRDQERSWRSRDDDQNWRSRDEDQNWRSRESGWGSGRDRSSMFGWGGGDRDSSRSRERGGDQDRGFFDRMGDQMGSWFGSDDDNDRSHYERQGGAGREQWGSQSRSGSSYGREGRNYGGYQSGWGQQNFGGEQSGQRYSAHPDDHYRSWRDKQMQALDRDYQDYCREREQQFHSDFDTWRQSRQGQSQSQSQSQGESGGSSSQSQQSGSSSSTMDLDNPVAQGGEIPGATTSAMGAATMGTNNSENTDSAPSATGRGRR